MAGTRAPRATRLRCALACAALVGGAVVATGATMAEAAASRPGPARHQPPQRLADTGLYSDFASRTVDPSNLPYSPQYPLWSDGAGKRRWIHLPRGASIDASDPDAWRFPVGTKFWKEFAWSRRVETSYLERTRQGWIYASYVWRDDESDAELAPADGLVSTHEVAPGQRHQIPSLADCTDCHRGGRAEILGFSALQLSPDRDPLAPNREPLLPGMVTLDALVARGLVRQLPRHVVERPPRVAATTPRGRAAMGYLRANCSNCHDAVGPLASLGVSLRHALRARAQRDEPAAAAIGHPSRFRTPGAASGESVWIEPGAPAASVLLARMSSRTPLGQMPPLGTRIVDRQAVELLKSWIEEDLRPPGPPAR